MLTLYYFLGFGLSGFAVGWILLRQISRVQYWRRLSRRTAQLHHGNGSGVPRFGGVAFAAAFVVAAIAACLPRGVFSLDGAGLPRSGRGGRFCSCCLPPASIEVLDEAAVDHRPGVQVSARALAAGADSGRPGRRACRAFERTISATDLYRH